MTRRVRRMALVAAMSVMVLGAAGVASAATARVAGDIAPLPAADGSVDVADVVGALRLALQLETADAETLLKADVSPATRMDDLVIVIGDGSITIGDVVLLLRASVGLDILAWPAHGLAVVARDDFDGQAWAVQIKGWPLWAVPVGIASEHCAPESLLVTPADGGFTIACPPPAEIVPAGADLALVTYRAPEPAPLDDMSATGTVLTDDLQLKDAQAGLESR